MSTVNSAKASAKKGMTPLNKVLAIIAVAMVAMTAVFGALAGAALLPGPADERGSRARHRPGQFHSRLLVVRQGHTGQRPPHR